MRGPKAHIQDRGCSGARVLRFESSLWKEPLPNYKPGLKVDGVEWKENYEAYRFAVRNPSKTKNVVDLRLPHEFPWAIISSQLHYHEGSEGVALAGRDDDTVKVGTERQIRQDSPVSHECSAKSMRVLYFPRAYSVER